MTFQNYTTFWDVYYHFECLTIRQFSQKATKDGSISSSVILDSLLSPEQVDMIREAVHTAHFSGATKAPTTTKAKWEIKQRKAAKRRRRREAKRRSTQDSEPEAEEVQDEDDEIGESAASGTEFSPEK